MTKLRRHSNFAAHSARSAQKKSFLGCTSCALLFGFGSCLLFERGTRQPSQTSMNRIRLGLCSVAQMKKKKRKKDSSIRIPIYVNISILPFISIRISRRATKTQRDAARRERTGDFRNRSFPPPPTPMPPTTPLRALRTARLSARLAQRRYASHGAPQFNEPSGMLFSEPVRAPLCCVLSLTGL